MANSTPINGLSIPELTDPPNIETALSGLSTADSLMNAVFATPTARDAAIPSPTVGMECYCISTAEKYLYSGTSWIGMVPRYRLKTVSQSVVASATLVDDDTFQWPVEASSTYHGTLNLVLFASHNGTNFKFGIAGPSGYGGFVGAISPSGDITDALVPQPAYFKGLAGAAGTIGVGTTPTNGPIIVPVYFTITIAATPGTLKLQFAEAVAVGGTSIAVSSSSYGEVRKVA